MLQAQMLLKALMVSAVAVGLSACSAKDRDKKEEVKQVANTGDAPTPSDTTPPPGAGTATIPGKPGAEANKGGQSTTTATQGDTSQQQPPPSVDTPAPGAVVGQRPPPPPATVDPKKQADTQKAPPQKQTPQNTKPTAPAQTTTQTQTKPNSVKPVPQAGQQTQKTTQAAAAPQSKLQPKPQQVAVLPLGTNGLAKDYALAGEDLLICMLEKRLNQIRSDSQKIYDTAVAQSITKVETKISADGRNVMVVVSINEGGKEQNYMLGGQLDGAQSAKLTMVQASGASKISGLFMCVDVNEPNCMVGVMDFSIRTSQGQALVYSVVRKTRAYLKWDRRIEPVLLSDASNAIMTMLESSTVQHGPGQIVANLVESFEVVHGISSARFTLLNSDNEVLSFHGPLLASEKGANVSMKSDVRIEQLIDILNPGHMRTHMLQAVKSARLVRVESGRYFTLELSLAGAEGRAAQTLKLRFERRHGDVKAL